MVSPLINIAKFTESIVEEATLEWLGKLGYSIKHGPDITPEESSAERINYNYYWEEDT